MPPILTMALSVRNLTTVKIKYSIQFELLDSNTAQQTRRRSESAYIRQVNFV